jgi:Tfp pilus assembly ATPase PilU
LLVMRTRPSIPFLLDLLRLAMRKEAAALYIVPWMPPTLRIDDRSVPLSSVSFTPEQSTLLVLDMLDDERRAALDRSRDIEFSFLLDGVGRFGVHAFRRHGQPAMAIRPFALDVPTPRTLALPALACQAALAERGLLVLASRSAALRRDAAAALMEHRNRSGDGELVLMDGATRFWHEPARCRVRSGLDLAALDELLQRHAPVPAAGAAPLAVAWGELRDGPQLERAVRAAERALCVVTLAADDPLTRCSG